MVLIDPAKSGLESGTQIDGYVSRIKTKILALQIKILLLFLCSVS